MPQHGKKYNEACAKVEPNKQYPVEEGVKLCLDTSTAKFDESVEVHFRLGVDPRHADQNVRGTTTLPHGTGRSVRVLVFAKGDKAREAEEAGADFVGAEDLVDKIKSGWTDFEKAVASPDMMSHVGKLGRILGPRGLMPNPKLGTVTMDVAKAVKDLKGGKLEFKVDKTGIVHLAIGKVSFGSEKVMDNFKALTEVLLKAKPASSKGTYLKSITLATTQGPGIKISAASAREAIR